MRVKEWGWDNGYGKLRFEVVFLSMYSVWALEGAHMYIPHLVALDTKRPTRPVVKGPKYPGLGSDRNPYGG